MIISPFQNLNNLPKHLLSRVGLSINTLAERTLPKGRNVCIRSASVNSGGKWYINRFDPSGPKIVSVTN